MVARKASGRFAKTVEPSTRLRSDRVKPLRCQHADLRTRVLGTELSMPLLLAPVGYLRVMHPDGEIAAARAAGRAGVGFILSTVSGHRLEDVKAASTAPVWYQLYLTGGRAAAENAMRRAMDVGYTVLVITIDSTVIGHRERESRDGMEQLLRGNIWSKIPFAPASPRPSTLADALSSRRRPSRHAQYRQRRKEVYSGFVTRTLR